MSREADRQELPALMRRDVRLLGDLLGEVIRESGGQDLLDDVERLRHAVIAARENPPQGRSPTCSGAGTRRSTARCARSSASTPRAR